MLRRVLNAFLLPLTRHWQRTSNVRDLELWGLQINGDGHLCVQGVDTTVLARRFGSPLLVVNRERLVSDINALTKAFERAPEGSKILYSYKTNCVPGILKSLHLANIGAEVISPYELWLAQKLGVSGDMILYNGVDKSDESLEQAIELGVLSINIDHLEEIDRVASIAANLGTRANVGVRLALSNHSQFGMDVESGEALQACKTILARSRHLNLRCVHVHLTSNAKNASAHKAYAETAIEFLRALRDCTGHTISYLDLGGGFGVPTTKNMSGLEYGMYRALGILPRAPRIADWQPVSEFMTDLIGHVEVACERHRLAVPRLVIEPGRLLTSRAEFLLASVKAVKYRRSAPPYAITDAGRLSITFPCDFEYHEVFLAKQPGAQLESFYNVMGRVCTSADWMFKNRLLPKLQPGDVLAIMDAGAYFSSYSSNFAFPRPAIVMVDGGTASIIRRGETFEHLTTLDDY